MGKSGTIIAVLMLHRDGKQVDIELPLDITANDLILGLNGGFRLDMDTGEIANCHLKAENPFALLKGNRTLEQFGLHDGSIIHITE